MMQGIMDVKRYRSRHLTWGLSCIRISGSFIMVISCSISCSIYDDRAKLHLEIALPITVGDNVWIGANVSVLPGVLSEQHNAEVLQY